MNPTTMHPAPPLPEDLTGLLRRMRLPYLRAAAPEVLATADLVIDELDELSVEALTALA